jgi:hypothetical protein
VICDAIQTDPLLLPVVGPYLVMRTQPAALRVVEGRVGDLLRSGWRPHFASGPTRDELVELIESVEKVEGALGDGLTSWILVSVAPRPWNGISNPHPSRSGLRA